MDNDTEQWEEWFSLIKDCGALEGHIKAISLKPDHDKTEVSKLKDLLDRSNKVMIEKYKVLYPEVDVEAIVNNAKGE